MGVLISILIRVWKVNYPPQPPKSTTALRFGILGTPWIASLALITPAKSHSGVIIAAVASRDLARAKAYTKKFNIPNSHGSYQALLDDPTIDAVYIALPNSLHYEWSIRALKAGKHVLLEKPSVSNSIEVESLFNFHASLPSTSRPVLLEAFHPRFHPAWHKFLSYINPKDVESVHARFSVPVGFFPKGNIRWDFDLSGGSLMDIGNYSIAALRDVFQEEPTECTSAKRRILPSPGDQRIDEGFKAEFKFPNGGVGRIEADIHKTSWLGLPGISLPRIVVQQKSETIRDENAAESKQTLMKTRKVTFWGFPGAHFWHSIEVIDDYVIKSPGTREVLNRWTTTQNPTAYVWDNGTMRGGAHWSTYRHMLDQFVNRVQGKGSSRAWINGADSIKQSKVIDLAYVKAGMPVRSTSSYQP